MKQLKIILLTTVLLFLTLCLRAQNTKILSSDERSPFSQTAPPVLRSPVDEPPTGDTGGGPFVGGDTGSGGPPVGPPGDDDGGGGWVGQGAVSDASWLLILLALGYGTLRSRKLRTTPKSPEGDLGE